MEHEECITLRPGITLDEVARAHPARGDGAPSRTRSHYDRILAFLRERGPAGVLSSELYDSPELYGRSPRNRTSEMRQDGCLIETVPAGASTVRYILIRNSKGAAPTSPVSGAEASGPQDWYIMATGKSRPAVEPSTYTTDLPLFDPVRQ